MNATGRPEESLRRQAVTALHTHQGWQLGDRVVDPDQLGLFNTGDGPGAGGTVGHDHAPKPEPTTA